MKPERILHLLIGAAVVAAYFIVTPSHLWQPLPGVQPSPTIAAEQSEGQWRRSELSLDGPATAVSVAQNGTAAPLLVAVLAGQPATVVALPLFADQAEVETLITSQRVAQLTGVAQPEVDQALYHRQGSSEWLLLSLQNDLVLLRRQANRASAPDWHVLKRVPRQHDGRQLHLANHWLLYEDGSLGVALFYPQHHRHSVWLRWRVDDGRVLLRRAMAASSDQAPAVWATDNRNMAALSGADGVWQMTGSMLAGREWQQVPRAGQVTDAVGAGAVAVLSNDQWWLASGCSSPRRGLCLQRSDNYGESWSPLRQIEGPSAVSAVQWAINDQGRAALVALADDGAVSQVRPCADGEGESC